MDQIKIDKNIQEELKRSNYINNINKDEFYISKYKNELINLIKLRQKKLDKQKDTFERLSSDKIKKDKYINGDVCLYRKEVNEIRDGTHFGELAIFTGERRSASIYAESDLHVVYLPQQYFKQIFGGKFKVMNFSLRTLRNMLQNTSRQKIIKLSYDFCFRTYKYGDKIYQKGEESKEIFLIKSGEVMVYKTENQPLNKHINQNIENKLKLLVKTFKKEKIQKLEILNSGQFFGFKEILEENQRQQSVMAITTVEVLVLSPQLQLTKKYYPPEFNQELEKKVQSDQILIKLQQNHQQDDKQYEKGVAYNINKDNIQQSTHNNGIISENTIKSQYMNASKLNQQEQQHIKQKQQQEDNSALTDLKNYDRNYVLGIGMKTCEQQYKEYMIEKKTKKQLTEENLFGNKKKQMNSKNDLTKRNSQTLKFIQEKRIKTTHQRQLSENDFQSQKNIKHHKSLQIKDFSDYYCNIYLEQSDKQQVNNSQHHQQKILKTQANSFQNESVGTLTDLIQIQDTQQQQKNELNSIQKLRIYHNRYQSLRNSVLYDSNLPNSDKENFQQQEKQNNKIKSIDLTQNYDIKNKHGNQFNQPQYELLQKKHRINNQKQFIE
ncbi:Cyclic nucleotide-binding protein [Pseudocohnilembus persalinus]|uniref:Cyclic nucleotide-binding protein n=1 Tax=Pseudocohnilembus persalinus TaxID=266149 RepID=A0A0V0R4J5_PSEPJ|nr:Cyclic nucleotide-binding protein [Pseudocohnilembus persalinus]|eukprot:KRX09390.1 Cyclic nucleotide-binding protein [Pseudocohnilembus persalinus]